MPLAGPAALVMSFDIAPEGIVEHDDWHTHEHLPERLSIPGFRRGTRWVATRGTPRYLVMYEVEALATLASPAYLERLNNPTPWTLRMMPHYRGMTRGFCSVSGSFGAGLGHACLLVHLRPAPGAEAGLRQWLLDTVLPPLPARPGLGSAHLLESAMPTAMTAEQRLRGADTGVHWVVLVMGYRGTALDELGGSGLDAAALAAAGAAASAHSYHRIDYALTQADVRR